MGDAEQQAEYRIIYLPPGSPDWAGLLTQFMLRLAIRDGKAFAAWSGDRLQRAVKKNSAVVALKDGELLGFLLFEYVRDSAELTFPWVDRPLPELADDLVAAAVQIIRHERPGIRHVRGERQTLPGETDPIGFSHNGFECHWRQLMHLSLDGWWMDSPQAAEYRLVPWNGRYLDGAAEVVLHANAGTLDARLYANTIGPTQQACRRGIQTILNGTFGHLLPKASCCALLGKQVVGVNFVISTTPTHASVIELAVDPSQQGHGLGRALMVYSLRELVQAHFERVELAVTRSNTAAVHLYESLGFLHVSDFPVCIYPATGE